jgi:hypothetical protein
LKQEAINVLSKIPDTAEIDDIMYRLTTVPFIQPNALFALGGGGGGVIMATGSPRFVTRRGSPLAFTRSREARQVALNFEIAAGALFLIWSFFRKRRWMFF